MTSSAGSSGFLLRFTKSGAGVLASQLVTFLTIPLLFRLYTPEAFGVWATLGAGALISGGLGNLRYELAVVKERDDLDASLIFRFCVLGGALLSTLIASASVAVWFSLVRHPNVDILDLALAWGWLISIALNAVVQAWLMRIGRFGTSSLSILISAAGSVLLQLALAPVLPGPHGLLAGSLMGQAAAVLWAVRGMAPRPPLAVAMDVRRLLQVLRRHARFPVFTAPFTLVSLLRDRAALFILGGAAPAADLGRYSQAWRLANIPVTLSGSAIRPVLFNEAARTGEARLERLVMNLLLLILSVGAPFVGFLMVAPTFLFSVGLGPSWASAGPMAAAVAPAALIYAVSNWMDRLLDVSNRQHINLAMEVLNLAGSVVPLVVALQMGAPLQTAIIFQGGSLALCYALDICIVFKILGYPVWQAIGAMVAAGIEIVAVWFAASAATIHLGMLPGLAVGAGVAILVSGSSAVVFGRGLLNATPTAHA